MKAINAKEEKRRRDAAALAQHQRLWSAINSFVSKNGGWLTSLPAERSLRLETRQGSDLPDKLYDLGYDLAPVGTNERIEGGKILPVVCFRFQIPMPR